MRVLVVTWIEVDSSVDKSYDTILIYTIQTTQTLCNQHMKVNANRNVNQNQNSFD